MLDGLIPVHLHNMITLAEKHPAVYQEFLHSNFIVNKSGCVFSNIAIDQANDQNNVVEGDGGAIRPQNNPEALR